MIPIAAAITATTALLALSILQILVAFGRPPGAFVYGGRHRVLPYTLRIASAGTVILYIFFAAVLFARAGILPGQEIPFIRVTTWVLFIFSTFSTAMNAISPSRPERRTAAPASFIMSVATLTLALSN